MNIQKISCLGKPSIHIGFHLLPHLASTLSTLSPSTSSIVIITDTTVASLHLPALLAALSSALPSTVKVLHYVVQPGEMSKSRATKRIIEDWMFSHRLTRDTVMIAFGGGVVGDLAGFVAATYMRGIRFVQLPTTLLAMVDSSVGGKTAIDVPAGKNLIGAFWQPVLVCIDLAFLSSLPAREVSNGFAEVIKTAAIWDKDEFDILEGNAADIMAAVTDQPSADQANSNIDRISDNLSNININTESNTQQVNSNITLTNAQILLQRVVHASISVKAHVVTVDERETGLRNLVNFGHTIGHAIEAVLTPSVLHGEAVSVGMILEAECARSMGKLSQVNIGRLTATLKSYNLPVNVGQLTALANKKQSQQASLDPLTLLDIMRLDKKNSGPEGKKIVLLSRIGATVEQRASLVPDHVIMRVLQQSVCVYPASPIAPTLDSATASVSSASGKSTKLSTPGSKSLSNRALILAALSGSPCRLKNLLHSDDTQVMMAALDELQGASFSYEDGGDTLLVRGNGGALSPSRTGKEIYLGNAGTAARFMTTVATLVSSSDDTPTVITGNSRMKQRPIGPLVDALRTNLCSIDYLEGQGCLPLQISSGGLNGGKIELAASVSSQYVSSILLCAPYASSPVVLELVGGQVISQPYIDMTISMMSSFGINVIRRPNSDTYDIPRGVYVAPAEYIVESDASSATYPLAIAAITGTTCILDNIGSSSLQGDAGFAIKVLKPMGCHVEQTANQTIVTGPPIGTLKSLSEIDFESMTDAFLTGSVLFAVCQGGPTKITGIANQRVKECNRIKAMCDELAKFNVKTSEHETGLTIHPVSIESLPANVQVHTYDDHRVAMAFSVLATVAKGVILEEKRCVEKTWPNWWDDLSNKIGATVSGYTIEPQSILASPAPAPSPSGPYLRNATMFVLGMRGAGKTFVGQIAAKALNKKFIDADVLFEERHQMPLSTFVAKNGWPAFRVAETEVLSDLIDKQSTGAIISLGGGVLETPKARELLSKYGSTNEGGPVVYVMREIQQIINILNRDTSRPAYGEEIEDVFKRREPWFVGCCTHRYMNCVELPLDFGQIPKEEADRMIQMSLVKHTKAITRYFSFISGENTNLIDLSYGTQTYFVPLTSPNVKTVINKIAQITEGVDAIELRVDLLSEDGISPQKPHVVSSSYVAQQLALIRLESDLPIVFTVRSEKQGGMHSSDKLDEAFALLEHAVAFGCEYVDVELVFSEKKIEEFCARKGNTQVILSWHDWTGSMKWDSLEVSKRYEQGQRLGDISKIVATATCMKDNIDLLTFRESVTTAASKPFLAINMGAAGQMSRILNPTLSPVTHSLLPSASAPGQITFSQTQKALNYLGQLPAKRFFLFGDMCKKSLSPTLHNTGFDILGLPHNYQIHESVTIDETVRTLLYAPDFGGASVTMPHKIEMLKYMDSVSDAVKEIGALNTITPSTGSDGKRILHGTNTDWQAIRTIISEGWNINDSTVALVIGAGGTARAALYALSQSGVKNICLFNRTLSTAEDVARSFSTFNIKLVNSLDSLEESPQIIINTVPASHTSSEKSANKLHLPEDLFSEESGFVLDVSYRPLETPLISMAKTHKGWNTSSGMQMLLEQGFKQFSLWTGRRTPREMIGRETWAQYMAHQ